jgi:uncharacterized membrane protein
MPGMVKGLLIFLPLGAILVSIFFAALIHMNQARFGAPVGRRWWFGSYYFDPSDASPLVPGLMGVGYRLNLGRPLGWVLAAPFTLPYVFWLGVVLLSFMR